MNFEKYTRVFENVNKHIHPQKSVTLTFDGDGLENASRLFFTGETNISYFWKSEPDYQMLYRRIDDSLRTDKTVHDRYCLDMSGGRVPYTKLVYKRLDAPFKLSYKNLVTFSDGWDFGVSATADSFKVYGYARVTLEVRYKRDGVNVSYTGNPPDKVFCVDIPSGSYDIKEISEHITVDSERIANVGYFVELCDCEGGICFEAPFFKNCEGRNLITQFAPYSADRPLQNWVGQNLSRIEWVDLKIDINGKTVFDGKVFERCHRFSEWEVTLDNGVIKSGENDITFTCLSDYRDAAGYDLGEIGFVSENPSAVVSVPETAVVGKPIAVLVDAPRGKKFDFCSDVIRPLSLECQNDGLNIITLVCDTPATDVKFTLDGECFTLPRCVVRGDDGVITGTGDLIYVNTNETDHKNYLKWYLSNNIGNLLTIRPTYRWNGSRLQNDGLWQTTTALLDKAGIKYSHMIDGRELPGLDCNPPVDVIDSDSFLGRQTHEFDGQFCYWGWKPVTDNLADQMYYDLYMRLYRQSPERCNFRFNAENMYYYDDIKQLFIDPKKPLDMKSAADTFVESLKKTRKGNLRHTGPATLFKYFYQAGYKWTGAELMYQPTEITCASIRGARNLYGGKTGAHHAVQWSSSPHDSEARYRRYRLALFISYIQDIDEINTEEGLWHLEEYYYYHNRFSPACVNHTKQQQDFYRFISTHTRSGKFYTPIAFLSGRYDGWRCFSRGKNTWGRKEFGFTDVEKAWDVLDYYYPKSVLDALYIHDCPNKAVGYYSGTPNGNVDIVPIEADSFDNYRLLVAIGYNCAMSDDIKKLEGFVKNGGTLVIGWPQLSVTTDRRDVVGGNHTYIDEKEHTFVPDSFNGNPVSVCDGIEYDSVVLYTDGKRPLVVKKHTGEGTLYFITAKEYAGARAVADACYKLFALVTPDIVEKESVYASGDSNVQFSVYNNDDGSKNIYFIATDWHKPDPSGDGVLVVDGSRYTVPVPCGQLVKTAVKDGVAVYPCDDSAEVISIADGEATVQGIGKTDFVILKDGESKKITVDLTNEPLAKIKIG